MSDNYQKRRDGDAQIPHSDCRRGRTLHRVGDVQQIRNCSFSGKGENRCCKRSRSNGTNTDEAYAIRDVHRAPNKQSPLSCNRDSYEDRVKKEKRVHSYHSVNEGRPDRACGNIRSTNRGKWSGRSAHENVTGPVDGTIGKTRCTENASLRPPTSEKCLGSSGESAKIVEAKHRWGKRDQPEEVHTSEEANSGGVRPLTLKPNFEPSGLLNEEKPPANERNGVLLKHCPPEDESIPDKRWRLYMFKTDKKRRASADEEPTKVMYIHRNSTYLFGKDQRVADVLLLHPTVSKQHAVLQFRKRFESTTPYILDLRSTNGTYLNGEKIEAARYIELREADTLRFGRSSREFVLLHSGSVAVRMTYADFLETRDKERHAEEAETDSEASRKE